MYRGKRVLCLVPARAGSQGLPGKNIIDLCGRPLIAYSIDAGLKCEYSDAVVVSTEDAATAAIAREAGAEVPFERPQDLATNISHMSDVVANALDELETRGEEYGYLVLLQPTSPLRTEVHLREAFERLEESGGRAVVSVCPAEHSPLWLGQLPEDGNMSEFLAGPYSRMNRQELGDFYRLNGAVYIAEVDYWRARRGFFGPETFAYVMDQHDSVDIDTDLDLALASLLMARRSTGS